MRVEVFKRTQDDWYGNYKVAGDQRVSDLVEVTFMNLYPGSESPAWRVCVWGNDDFGLERDFDNEAWAWNIFLQVIGMEFVNQQGLRDLGFVSA
jgi:hypothetical protein